MSSKEPFRATHWFTFPNGSGRRVKVQQEGAGVYVQQDGSRIFVQRECEGDFLKPVSRQAKCAQRKAAERPPHPRKARWANVDWRKSDIEIGIELGVAPESVCRQRRNAGGMSRLTACQIAGLRWVLDRMASRRTYAPGLQQDIKEEIERLKNLDD